MTVFFVLLVSTRVKAACRTLVKLTPDHDKNLAALAPRSYFLLSYFQFSLTLLLQNLCSFLLLHFIYIFFLYLQSVFPSDKCAVCSFVNVRMSSWNVCKLFSFRPKQGRLIDGNTCSAKVNTKRLPQSQQSHKFLDKK